MFSRTTITKTDFILYATKIDNLKGILFKQLFLEVHPPPSKILKYNLQKVFERLQIIQHLHNTYIYIKADFFFLI